MTDSTPPAQACRPTVRTQTTTRPPAAAPPWNEYGVSSLRRRHVIPTSDGEPPPWLAM